MALCFRAPLTAEEARFSNMVYLARELGWTLDYIESLDIGTFNGVLATLQAHDKAQAQMQRRRQKGGYQSED